MQYARQCNACRLNTVQDHAAAPSSPPCIPPPSIPPPPPCVPPAGGCPSDYRTYQYSIAASDIASGAVCSIGANGAAEANLGLFLPSGAPWWAVAGCCRGEWWGGLFDNTPVA